jgi:hypothetical protein
MQAFDWREHGHKRVSYGQPELMPTQPQSAYAIQDTNASDENDGSEVGGFHPRLCAVVIMSRNKEQTFIVIDGLDIVNEAGLAETLPSTTGRRLDIVLVCQLCFVVLNPDYSLSHRAFSGVFVSLGT